MTKTELKTKTKSEFAVKKLTLSCGCIIINSETVTMHCNKQSHEHNAGDLFAEEGN